MEQMPVLVRLCHWMDLVLVLVPLRLHHRMEQMLVLVLLHLHRQGGCDEGRVEREGANDAGGTAAMTCAMAQCEGAAGGRGAGTGARACTGRGTEAR